MAGNQYVDDPRQALFLSLYLDTKSETFSNALQSALKAGYAQEYAESITSQMPDWLSEKLGKAKLLKKAERVIENLMDGEDDRIKADLAKFVAGRLGKKEWSERIERTGEDGKPETILVKFINENDKNPD